VLASQHADARDKEVHLPMMFVSAVATCFSLAITSPLAEEHPKQVRYLDDI
jgi:organic hydroperoxide reductase OsmC/OhrA